ncbi:U3 small nucleolar RNA-associated protein [Paecilomyces lecythidis]|uniref:U3 small nucleolar RNA-associated protein n=1 Tax=Paecilomyces lecythidis TaxID=3004212 RepID=A0ABR3YB09_9EURO
MDIHRCRFVPYNPQAINALAFSHPPAADQAGRGVPTLRLAIGRANGDIEIWNPLRGAWFQETVFRGGKDRSIEGIVWTLDPAEDNPDGSNSKLPGKLRLFSIGYSTAVTEWDLEQGRPARHSSGNYGEIWCLAAQPRWKATKRGKDGKLLPPAEGEYTGQHLAAGCADGSIVILSTADSDLKFLRIMRPSTKRARVLSITFQTRDIIVAGYADSCIRLFDIRNGQQLRTVSLGRGPTGGPKEILVWTVKSLPDGTIVSGDSTGEIRFWDAKNYSLIQRLQNHQADVLDVAVSADGETVISGGADQRTVVYRLKDGEKGDKRRRWAEVMHRRYHTHDVKTFAVYETKEISIVVSGGPDASPVVLPMREFGKEHHRKLSSLPQIPQITSSPSSRLIMSFWDREVSIWRMSRGPESLAEGIDAPKHRLVAKVLVQGEENIASATLSPDGKLLAVATISSVKLFSVRRRKGDERGTLRVQKLDLPSELANDGARLVSLSSDSQWLSVVRPNSDIYLARIVPAVSPQEKPQVLPQLTKVERAPRRARHEKAGHGTLGNFERTIRSIAFSGDSKILAAGDLSGCVDTWVLTEATADAPKKTQRTEEDSDDESDDDDEQPVIEGQRWQRAPTESPIPRLQSGIILLSFRPQADAKVKLLTNGSDHPANDEPTAEYRLMAVTSEHQLVEFDASKGKLSEWSRRNPKAYLPAEFTGVKDRAMGAVWDVHGGRERLWLYGTSWLWMFDLTQDFPSEKPDDHEDGLGSVDLVKAASHKRKRELEEEEAYERKKQNSGAGDRIPRSQADVFMGTKVRRIDGRDEAQGEWISLEKRHQRGDDEEDYEHDEKFIAESEANLARLRRGSRQEEDSADVSKRLLNGAANGDISTPKKKSQGRFDSPSQQQLAEVDHDGHPQPPRRWWHTYKYRDLLGVVPLQKSDEEEDEDEEEDDQGLLEVAVVERPMWDVDLPGRYVRDYE